MLERLEKQCETRKIKGIIRTCPRRNRTSKSVTIKMKEIIITNTLVELGECIHGQYSCKYSQD